MMRDLLAEVQDIGSGLEQLRCAVDFIRVSCDELADKVEVGHMMPSVMAMFLSKIDSIDLMVSDLGHGLLLERTNRPAS